MGASSGAQEELTTQDEIAIRVGARKHLRQAVNLVGAICDQDFPWAERTAQLAKEGSGIDFSIIPGEITKESGAFLEFIQRFAVLVAKDYPGDTRLSTLFTGYVPWSEFATPAHFIGMHPGEVIAFVMHVENGEARITSSSFLS